MLHTNLLRLINTRSAWALVGSGPSIEAGCPSWDSLLADAVASLDPPTRSTVEADSGFKHACKHQDLPAAFQTIQDSMGRAFLESSVASSIGRCRQPGSLHNMLAELPFAGYITTNYDGLLEQALNKLEPGWTSVGNLGDEVRKASGAADGVVWHIHGAAEMASDRSRLLLTREDYDSVYLDDSVVLRQLKGLMANRRVVIVGFGFRDAEVMRMMRAVGRFTDHTRSIFALVEKAGEFRRPDDRKAFLRSHNIDTQPYRNQDGRHGGLRQTLQVYTAMSLRRSLRYGRHLTEPPSYNPETTGLLIYNDLALAGRADVPDRLRNSILRSRVLAVCESTAKTREQIAADISRVLEAVSVRLAGNVAAEQVDAALDAVLNELTSEGLLEATSRGYTQSLGGRADLADHVAASSLLEEQFDQSLMTRIERLAAPLGVRPAAPAKVVRAFFREAIRRRALGVALAFATGGSPNQQEYHALALMQSIGDWLDKAENEAEALVVVEVIQDVFREPSRAESEYIGLSIQARFVLHLLGLDEDTLNARVRELGESVFIVDSTTLIPWLAQAGAGNDAADVLIRRLREAGAAIATTAPLVSEVAEHARWAQKAIRDAGDVQSVPVFEAATGRAGTRSNAFLDAYLAFIASRGPTPFDVYLGHCLGRRSVSHPVTDNEFRDAITGQDVTLLQFEAAAGLDPTITADRTAYEGPIKERRLANSSFQHDRQVRTEAEAVVLVERARSGLLDVGGVAVQNGYFLSYTSLLNDIAKSPAPVTMKPEAALSWLSTLRPSSREESRVLVSEMLWELQERRMNLVDQATLITAFGPLLTATKRELAEVIPKYQALVAQRFGGDQPPAVWPEDVPELELPVVLDVLEADRVRQLEALVAEQATALDRARIREEEAEMTAAELEALRVKQKRKNKYDRQMARRRDRR